MNIEGEVANLRRMTAGQLAGRYQELFGETTNTRNTGWLLKRIIWKLQSLSLGGLPDRARQRARELAVHADFRMTAPRTPPGTSTADQTVVVQIPAPLPDSLDRRLPPPGTILTRQYKGGSVQVRVLPNGFEHEGNVYRSLSAAAKAATGTHVNGYQFFQLGQGESA